MFNKRYSYIIALRNNTNAVSDPSSNYRLSSGQVRGQNMDLAFETVLQKEGVTLERDNSWSMRVAMDYFRNGQRVGVYLSPVADDAEKKEQPND